MKNGIVVFVLIVAFLLVTVDFAGMANVQETFTLDVEPQRDLPIRGAEVLCTDGRCPTCCSAGITIEDSLIVICSDCYNLYASKAVLDAIIEMHRTPEEPEEE